MNQRQFNYLHMVKDTTTGLREDHAVWEQESEIVALVQGINNDYDQIITKGENISAIFSTSYTTPKNDCFGRAINKTYKLACKLSGYAKVVKDAKLLPLVDISATGLIRGTEKEVLLRCAAIANQAELLLPVVSRYKVTAEEIAYIRQMINECDEHVSLRSVASTGRMLNGKEIEALILSMREKFDILDDLIEGLIEDEGFISRYKSLRIITDYGKKKTLKNKGNENENEKNVA